MSPGTKRNRKKRAGPRCVWRRRKEEAQALLQKLEQMTHHVQSRRTRRASVCLVSPADVLAQLAANGIELQKKQLAMYEPFKSLGDHEAHLHLHPEVRGVLKIKVVAEKTAVESDAE